MCALIKLVQFCVLALQMEVGKEDGKIQHGLLLIATIILIIVLMISFVANGATLLH
jgi:hypothetical protein